MIPLLSFTGFVGNDPLDKAAGLKKFLLLSAVNLVLTLIIFFIISTFDIVKFNGFTLFGIEFTPFYTIILEILVNCLLFSTLVVLMRKSSSIIHFLIILIPYFLIDVFYEMYYRHSENDKSLWHYENSFLPNVIFPLKSFLTIAFDAVLLGIIGLYIARLLAAIIYKNIPYPLKPTKEQYDNLFTANRSSDDAEKPHRDWMFWALRILGLFYGVYLLVLVVGGFANILIPTPAKDLVAMTYQNPALAINTYVKILVMITLAFLGAFNRELRWYACLCLAVGHGVSTIYSIGFYLLKPFEVNNVDFLLTSGIVDGAMIATFILIMAKSKKYRQPYDEEHDFPIYFSVPTTLTRYLFIGLSILFASIMLGILGLRLFTEGVSGLSGVYGFPDPMIGNTLTFYGTLSFISYILINRFRLRQHLFGVIIVPLLLSGIIALLWILLGDAKGTVLFETRQHTFFSADWYYVLLAIFNISIASLLLMFRKLYFRIDYSLNNLSPAAANVIVGMTQAFFDSDNQTNSSVLKSVDLYVGGIHGRKRGLLNMPFGLMEYLPVLYGLRPPLSTLSRDEQRHFLRKYVFRNEWERAKAIIPGIANMAQQMGLATNIIVMFAYYCNNNVRHNIGFVPVDARDRTQGDYAKCPPPFEQVAALPKDEKDALNWKPDIAGDGRIVAPRVTTIVGEPAIPDSVDYLIIGSGAGGAVAAYRLACEVEDPSKIYMIERGNRYQPLQDFQDNEIMMMQKVYKEGGLQQAKQFNMTLLQGECVGGTTVINNAVCFKMPDSVKQDWTDNYGIDLTTLDDEYDRIAEEIDIKPLGANGINQLVKEKFMTGIKSLNTTLPPDEKLMPDKDKIDTPSVDSSSNLQEPMNADSLTVSVNHVNNFGDGSWNLGNKRMRKRSMLETYIPWAESRGVNVISNMTAVRFMPTADGKKADTVLLRTNNGDLYKVKVNKAVIIAGGVIASSHFLMRSEVPNEHIGKNMSCNFAIPLAFEFEDDLKAFDGDQITLGALAPDSKAAFETYFNPPAAFALSNVPFIFNRRLDIMNRYRHLVNFGCLVGSEPNGVIQKKPDVINGQPFTWTLGQKQDVPNLKYGITTLIKLGQDAGAIKAFLPTKPGVVLDLTNKKDVDDFINSFNNYPLRMADVAISTAHPQGGNGMAANDSLLGNKRVVTENFNVNGFDNVFVVDASIFPTSLTINPQWTIMAMSSMAVKRILKSV